MTAVGQTHLIDTMNHDDNICFDCDHESDEDGNSYQVSIDPLEYLLDPVGVVSTLRAPVDGVGVGAVTEGAEMGKVRRVEIFKSSSITILKSLETSDQDYQAGVRLFSLKGLREGVHLLLGQFGGYWDHAGAGIP